MRQKFVNKLIDGAVIHLVFLERYRKIFREFKEQGTMLLYVCPLTFDPCMTFALTFSGLVLSRTLAPYYPFGQCHIFLLLREWEILESKRLYFSLKPAVSTQASYFYPETSLVFSLIP